VPGSGRVPAANTTCPAVKVRAVRRARHAPVRTVSTEYPPGPSGRIAVTGKILKRAIVVPPLP
jgi:hypothetical protein